jgi:hypothetical protein
MPDYDRTVTVSGNVEATYAFLADPQNLPHYVATMVMARPDGSDNLRVAADVQGRREVGAASFRTDPSAHRISWGAEGDRDYSGWLQVSPSGESVAVALHLHVPETREQAEIERAIDETMSNIERLFGKG